MQNLPPSGGGWLFLRQGVGTLLDSSRSGWEYEGEDRPQAARVDELAVGLDGREPFLTQTGDISGRGIPEEAPVLPGELRRT